MADVSRFDKNITTVGVRLHDNRVQADGDSGESTFRYSKTLLTKYENQAIRDTIRETYLKYGDKFDSVMPEMTSESTDITLATGVGTLPADCWIVLECAKNDYSWYAHRIKENNLKVKAGKDAMLPANVVTRPVFYQTGLTIVVLPTSITGPARIWYIQQPQDLAIGAGTVIPISPMWDGEIVERMVAMGLADAKSSIAV